MARKGIRKPVRVTPEEARRRLRDDFSETARCGLWWLYWTTRRTGYFSIDQIDTVRREFKTREYEFWQGIACLQMAGYIEVKQTDRGTTRRWLVELDRTDFGLRRRGS